MLPTVHPHRVRPQTGLPREESGLSASCSARWGWEEEGRKRLSWREIVTKGKTNPESNQAKGKLLLAETRSMYWQSAWSRSRSKLGQMGDGVRADVSQGSIS